MTTVVLETPTAKIMKSHLSQINVMYNDMNTPIGSENGCIVERYPLWVEDNTLWKINVREKPIRILKPVQAYYDLAKASYLELHQVSLTDWTIHQFKCYNMSLRHITMKRLNQLIEEERKIEQEKEKAKEKEKENEKKVEDDQMVLDEETEKEKEKGTENEVQQLDLHDWLAPYFEQGYFSI